MTYLKLGDKVKEIKSGLIGKIISIQETYSNTNGKEESEEACEVVFNEKLSAWYNPSDLILVSRIIQPVEPIKSLQNPIKVKRKEENNGNLLKELNDYLENLRIKLNQSLKDLENAVGDKFYY